MSVVSVSECFDLLSVWVNNGAYLCHIRTQCEELVQLRCLEELTLLGVCKNAMAEHLLEDLDK